LWIEACTEANFWSSFILRKRFIARSRRRNSRCDPNNAEVQRDVASALSALAAAGGTQVRWADALAQWQSLQKKGVLVPGDEQYLADAQRRADAEAGK
jgi:hypothetical protein